MTHKMTVMTPKNPTNIETNFITPASTTGQFLKEHKQITISEEEPITQDIWIRRITPGNDEVAKVDTITKKFFTVRFKHQTLKFVNHSESITRINSHIVSGERFKAYKFTGKVAHEMRTILTVSIPTARGRNKKYFKRF